jgi:hypothetical protein
MLNRIWNLSRDSIKATTFAGVFVDGDRERIAYEADAYLNQLSFYACNPDPAMARDIAGAAEIEARPDQGFRRDRHADRADREEHDRMDHGGVVGETG